MPHHWRPLAHEQNSIFKCKTTYMYTPWSLRTRKIWLHNDKFEGDRKKKNLRSQDTVNCINAQQGVGRDPGVSIAVWLKMKLLKGLAENCLKRFSDNFLNAARPIHPPACMFAMWGERDNTNMCVFNIHKLHRGNISFGFLLAVYLRNCKNATSSTIAALVILKLLIKGINMPYRRRPLAREQNPTIHKLRGPGK